MDYVVDFLCILDDHAEHLGTIARGLRCEIFVCTILLLLLLGDDAGDGDGVGAVAAAGGFAASEVGGAFGGADGCDAHVEVFCERGEEGGHVGCVVCDCGEEAGGIVGEFFIFIIFFLLVVSLLFVLGVLSGSLDVGRGGERRIDDDLLQTADIGVEAEEIAVKGLLVTLDKSVKCR